MQTTVTERGQVSIPSSIRKKFRLTPGTGLEWIETDEGIFLLPVPSDPIKSFRGKSQGLGKILKEQRSLDRQKEKP